MKEECDRYHLSTEQRNIVNLAKAWKRVREEHGAERQKYEAAIARLDRAVEALLASEARERRERKEKREAPRAPVTKGGLRLVQGGAKG